MGKSVECDEIECDSSTSMTDSFLFNRYEQKEEEEESTEFMPKGRLTFAEWERFEQKRLEMINEVGFYFLQWL
ncbi:unnamed protein product [Bursaphelenchus xylophilus]|uniref:(pine wood nematode) hypothetical protein n=1 Tax=Bursaphelenchus xylophilus TaxID=6326 RepID=A0A1I7S0R6_BURXY|nr:unnamed protein product [Bursaphelenchus xylophilus]CAG9088303.1 unnamed protein product [Bursaphelenchus xylophilus]